MENKTLLLVIIILKATGQKREVIRLFENMLKHKIIKRHVFEFWKDNKPEAIVWHTLYGTLEGSISWLKRIRLSYNYIIGADGTIIEQVPPHLGAWHAGVFRNPTAYARKYWGKKNPNRHSIGIAFERRGEENLTEAQIQAGRWLRDKLKKEWNIEEEQAHYEISTDKPVEVLHYMRQMR